MERIYHLFVSLGTLLPLLLLAPGLHREAAAQDSLLFHNAAPPGRYVPGGLGMAGGGWGMQGRAVRCASSAARKGMRTAASGGTMGCVENTSRTQGEPRCASPPS